MDFFQQLQVFRERVDAALHEWVPLDPTTPGRLRDAMQHSLHAGGKRIRPVLLLAVFEMEPTDRDPLPAAVAVECLHTYSLIHDDLPSMDDSALRRGAPTCHIAFDEATAILAGDALLTLAFEVLSTAYASEPLLAVQLVQELSRSAGAAQLVGGQMEDVQLDRETEGRADMERIYQIEDRKTGALFCASLRMGMRLCGQGDARLQLATQLGHVIGRSFQIVDDLLDATGDEAMVGKTLLSDERNQKVTAVTHYGIEGARREVERLHQMGLKYCDQLGGQVEFMQSLLHHLKNRVS